MRPGDYRESLVIDKAVTIRGDGARELVVIRPRTPGEPCVSITDDAPHLRELSIKGGDLPAQGDEEPVELIRVTGGAPVLRGPRHRRWRRWRVVSGPQTKGLLRSCVVHDGQGDGIQIWGSAAPRIEQNEIWANAHAGMAIGGTGRIPWCAQTAFTTTRGSGSTSTEERSRNSRRTKSGLTARAGSPPRALGPDPLVRANRVHDVDGAALLRCRRCLASA